MQAMRRTLSISLLAALGACHHDRAAAPRDLTTLVSKGNVQVLVLQEPSSTRDTAVFTVRVIAAADVPLAAYQGALLFDPAAFEVYEVSVPEAADGEFRIANKNDATTGRLRFAAFATEKFSSTEVLTVKGHLKTANAIANFDATLDLAGETKGTAVTGSRLQRASGVRNAITGDLLK